MDPNAALATMRRLLGGRDADGNWYSESEAQDFADLFEGLDEWISNGGFLPSEWRNARHDDHRE